MNDLRCPKCGFGCLSLVVEWRGFQLAEKQCVRCACETVKPELEKLAKAQQAKNVL